MSHHHLWRKLLMAITIWVGIGNAWPKSANIDANIGITNTKRPTMTTAAMLIILIGYTMAPLTWLFSFMAFSIYAASLLRMVSSIPPTSPAATRLTERLSKTFGCFF